MNNLNYRYQQMEGLDWPSVTEVCNAAMKWGLVYFYGKHGTQKAQEISQEAINIGIGLHSYIKAFYSKNKEIYISGNVKDLEKVISNFELFNTKYIPEPLLVEQIVWFRKYQYVGTLDTLALINNNLVLIDWKTSSDIYSDHVMQINAYCYALCDMFLHGQLIDEVASKLSDNKRFKNFKGKELGSLWLVRLDKVKPIDLKKDIVKLKPDLKAFNAFKGLLTYYNWQKKFDKQ